jgi:acetoacetyl-CoA reductase/3-oxoacyl-[acyl-carrier protein] reductase
MSVAKRLDPALLVSLSGKAALVTGGGGGIGAATCELLLASGARVASVDLPGRGAPEDAIAIAADLREPAPLQRAVARALEEMGRLDIAIHCAGIARDAVLWKLDDAAWSDVMRVNLDAAFWLLRAVVPALRSAGGGAIVLVSSINGERGKFGQANYAASKAGLLGLARTASRELGAFGIRVNVVAPGIIDTPMTAALPEDVRRKAVDETALGRMGSPEDVAAATLFLVSPMARHVTGQVLRVDGGQLMA